MSEQQEIFIKKLKITLIATLLPFSLALGASAIADHFQIRNNRVHIEAMENQQKAYATTDMLLIYYNHLREANQLTREELTKNNADINKRLDKINDEMDDLMKEVFQMQQRGGKKEDNQ